MMTTNMHRSLFAIPLPSERDFAASMPKGVAAFESPKRFAEMFAQTASMAWGSSRVFFMRRPTGRRRSRASAPATPHARMTAIMPCQKHSIPTSPTTSVTACAAPSSAAFPSAFPRPVAKPKIIETSRIAAHILSIKRTPPFRGKMLQNSTFVLPFQWKHKISMDFFQFYFINTTQKLDIKLVISTVFKKMVDYGTFIYYTVLVDFRNGDFNNEVNRNCQKGGRTRKNRIADRAEAHAGYCRA